MWVRWLGHARRMGDHRLLKSYHYGELGSGSCSTRHLKLRFKVWRTLASMSQIGKKHQLIARNVELPWQDSWRRERRSWEKYGPTSDGAGMGEKRQLTGWSLHLQWLQRAIIYNSLNSFVGCHCSASFFLLHKIRYLDIPLKNSNPSEIAKAKTTQQRKSLWIQIPQTRTNW